MKKSELRRRFVKLLHDYGNACEAHGEESLGREAGEKEGWARRCAVRQDVDQALRVLFGMIPDSETGAVASTQVDAGAFVADLKILLRQHASAGEAVGYWRRSFEALSPYTTQERDYRRNLLSQYRDSVTKAEDRVVALILDAMRFQSETNAEVSPLEERPQEAQQAGGTEPQEDRPIPAEANTQLIRDLAMLLSVADASIKGPESATPSSPADLISSVRELVRRDCA